MPRLRNAQTGVVVNVADETVGQLGSDWEPADRPVPVKAPAKPAAKPVK